MKSCLYNCEIYHDRARPKVHRLRFRMFMFCLDLGEQSALCRLPLIGREPDSPYCLRTADHLDFGKSTILGNLEYFLRKEGYNGTIGRVRLITSLRTFGHLFNPVSFYFVEDKQGDPACVVAEVANTFNEQKLYYLPPERQVRGRFRDEQIKSFYISPFSDLDTRLHFKLQFPTSRLQIAINESDSEGTYFQSGITGEAMPLTTPNLLRQTLRFPFVTVQVILAIHWHALRLYFKKIPVRRKSDHPEHQTRTRTYLKRRVFENCREPAI